MKFNELQGMSDEQLSLTLAETEKHLFQLRFQSATDRLETPSEIRKAKADIARIKTLQRQRELNKLTGLSPDAVAKAIADLEAKTEGPGKRRAKRALARLESLPQGKTASTVAGTPAKGK